MPGHLTPSIRKAVVVALVALSFLVAGCDGPSSGRLRDGRERPRQDDAGASKGQGQGKTAARRPVEELESPGLRDPVPPPLPPLSPPPPPAAVRQPAVQPHSPAPILATREDLERRPAPGNLSVKDIQYLLKELGYDPGTMDGKLGSRTRAAIKAFQRDQGLAADGVPGTRTRQELLVRAQGSYKQGYRRR